MVHTSSLLPTIHFKKIGKTTTKITPPVTTTTPTATGNGRIRQQWIPFLVVACFVILQIHTFKPSVYLKTEIVYHIEEKTERATTTKPEQPRNNHPITTTTTTTTTIKTQPNNKEKKKEDDDNSHNNNNNNNKEQQEKIVVKKSDVVKFCNDCIVKVGKFNSYNCYDRAKYLATKHYNGDMVAAQNSLLFEKNECISLRNNKNNKKITSTSTSSSSSSTTTGDNDDNIIGFCIHCKIAVGFNTYKCDDRAKYLSKTHYKGNLKAAQKSITDQGDCTSYKNNNNKKLSTTNNFTTTIIPRHEMCFVTSDFAESIGMADLPPILAKEMITTPKRHFLFTNLPSLEVEDGWNKIVMNITQLPFKRKITQSRWPKFLGWKHPSLGHCQVIFYGDTYLMNPVEESMWMRFAETILSSTTSQGGLMQQKQIGTYLEGPEAELYVTANTGKATRGISLKTIQWLRNQEDYNPRSKVYKNAIIGYDPHNPKFQKLTEDFWNTYSKEELTWRDQPLWSYFLEKHHITPLPMTDVPLQGVGKKGFNNHKYNSTVVSK